MIDNEANGVFDIETSGNFNADDSSSLAFNNDGLLETTSTASSTFGVLLVNESGGTVVADTGTLQLNDGGSNANTSGTAFTADDGYIKFAGGTFTFDGNATMSSTSGGQIDLDNGTLIVDGTVGVNAFDFSDGTIDGNGALSLSGTNTWSAGTENALLIVNSGAVLNVPSGVTLGSSGYSGATLENFGTVNMNGGDIDLSDSAAINNEANGVFDMAATNANFNADDSSSLAFNNDGLLETTSTASSTFGVLLVNESGGTVVADTGTLQLNDGGSNANTSGTAFTADDGYIKFAGGTFTFDGNATMSSTSGGQIDLDNGTLIVDGTVGVNAFDFSDGTIDGNGALSLSGTNTWSAGTENALLIVNSGAVLNVPSGVTLGSSGYSGATLENFGTVNMNGGDIDLSDSAAINNEANGVFDIETSDPWTAEDATEVFYNDGLLEKTDDSLTSFGEVPLVNESGGAVVVDAGTLQITDGGSNANTSGTAFTADGSSLQFNGGTYTFDGNTAMASSSGGQLELTNGTLTVDAGLTITGTLTLDYSTTLQLAGTGTINGGTINAEQIGSVPWGDESTAYIEIDTGVTVTLATGTTLEGGAVIESSSGDPALINEGTIDPLALRRRVAMVKVIKGLSLRVTSLSPTKVRCKCPIWRSSRTLLKHSSALPWTFRPRKSCLGGPDCR